MTILITCHRCGKPGSLHYGGPESQPLKHACEKCKRHSSYISTYRSRENKMIISDKIGVVANEHVSTVH